MKPCILCGEQTNGSIGAAGIAWSCICQKCKDKEDQALLDNLRYTNMVMQLAHNILADIAKAHGVLFKDR